MNKECGKGTFAEQFDFFDEKGRRTKWLQDEILRVSLTQSSVAASRYLKLSIADVSKSTICSLLKRGSEKTVEKMGINAVCIDDFALKKRQRYGTVMVDLETHKIVDMIESREMSDVSCWLSKYPDLRIVSRDGSLTYAAAINKSHPGVAQISDRFYLIK